MSDAAAVLLAAAAWVGALASTAVPLALAGGVVSLALLLRRPLPLCAGVLLLASTLGARAWSGLAPPAITSIDGWVTLVGDPVPVVNALRVDVRVDGHRFEAWARGEVAAAIRTRAAGDRVLLRGRVRPVPDDARERLAVRHVAARLSVDAITGMRPAGGVDAIANAARARLVDGAQSLPADGRALFAGIVLGDDRGQPAEVVDDFRGAGLTHLLAVSGQNVAFAMALAAPLLTRLRRRTRVAGALAVLALFGTITRWEPSVVRATAMAAAAVIATASGRRQTVIRVLALAVAGSVLVDPLLVHATGFRLSVAATAGIALLARPIAATMPGPTWLATAVAVPLAAELAVAPLLVASFGTVPLVSLPANLAAAPIAGPLMTWGMSAGLVAGFVPAPVAALLHVPTRLMVVWLAGVARAGAGVPVGGLGVAGVLVVTVLAGCWLACRSRRGRVVVGVVAVSCMFGQCMAVRTRDLWAHRVAAGAVVWRTGTTTVLQLEGARPLDLLAGLREAGIGPITIVVLGSDRAAEALSVVQSRHHVGTLAVASTSQYAGTRVGPAGARFRAGPLIVTLRPAAEGLQVAVARGPPPTRVTRVRAVLLALGARTYDIRYRALVMGILNRTPDSFYDKGGYWDFDAFLRRADALVAEGADILDVGGVKAGPGPEVDEDTELERVAPAIEALHARFDVPLSADTWRASVAAASYEVGAVVGNDISGFGDPDYLAVSAKANATVVATHIRLQPRVADPEPHYDDVVAEVTAFLLERAARAEAYGIPPERIVLDAGLDLGKTWQQSVALLRASEHLASQGYPLLLSASNKTFLGKLLDLEIDQRASASLAATAIGVAGGCRIIRAHDVRGTKRVCDVLAAVLEHGAAS